MRFYATKLFNLSGKYCKAKYHSGSGKTGSRTDQRNPSKKETEVKLQQVEICPKRSKEFKERSRREAKKKPIMIGSHKMEESPEEKYLGDQIHTNRLAASILSTINKCIGKFLSKINKIMNLSEHPRMTGMINNRCAHTRNLFNTVTPDSG